MFELETNLIFWNTLSFLILVVLMYKWALPPLLQLLKDREKTIKESLAAAAQNQSRSEALLTSAKEKMASANISAEKIIGQAKNEGDKFKHEIIVTAKKEAELLIDRAKEELNQEKRLILAELQQQTADLVAAASSRVLNKKIDKSENARLIEESLQEWSKQKST